MNLQEQIVNNIREALRLAQARGDLPSIQVDDIPLERPQDPRNGDFASSVALKLARTARANPMVIAEKLAALIPTQGAIGRAWAARPGFLNFALNPGWLASQVDAIRDAGTTYGNIDIGKGSTVQIEFVSANPTGPLHVGATRGAVFGSALANILNAAGYKVTREYYINDTGNQLGHFRATLLARYKQQFGIQAEIPEEGYRGAYMIELASRLKDEYGPKFLSMPDDEAAVQLGDTGVRKMVDAIRTDMKDVGVVFDVWFSEQTLYENSQYERAMQVLDKGGYLSRHDGAVWFVSTALGEDKDNVLVRSTGVPTYFALDIAYHYNKFIERHFDQVIDIWGADHQGHVTRMKAMAKALGVSPDRLVLIFYQMVTLKRGNEVVRASKRTGDLITLRELLDEVGKDPCRFFFLTRSPDSQMEFDLELAKRQSADNPVYYIQYAHARIAGILRLATERGIDYSDGDLSLLTDDSELALIRKMLYLPELIEVMARTLQPHHLPHYAVELATSFHWFYQQCRVVSSEPGDLPVTKARLKLVDAARTTLARCLNLMIMAAPEQM